MSDTALITVARSDDCLANNAAVPSLMLCSLLLVVVVASLRLCGFARTLRLIRSMTRGDAVSWNDTGHAFATATAKRLALVAALYPGRARCLEQSLTLYWLLRRSAMSVVLRLGVQPTSFAAHAWVEYGGSPILENEMVHTMLPFPGHLV